MCPYWFGCLHIDYFKKMSVQDVPCSHLGSGYSQKHDYLNEELYLHHFQMQIGMPMVIILTMGVLVTTMIDFTLPLCSSFGGGKEGSVKMCCSGMVLGWVAASVLLTWGISSSDIRTALISLLWQRHKSVAKTIVRKVSIASKGSIISQYLAFTMYIRKFLCAHWNSSSFL